MCCLLDFVAQLTLLVATDLASGKNLRLVAALATRGRSPGVDYAILGSFGDIAPKLTVCALACKGLQLFGAAMPPEALADRAFRAEWHLASRIGHDRYSLPAMPGK
jgi:hypothetical protein